MMISQLLKPNVTSKLFFLLIALQISACSTEDSTSAQTKTSFLESITGNNTGIVNSPAVISGVDASQVTEEVGALHDDLLERKGKLDITDSDAGEAAFIATTIIGSYGSLTIDVAGNWYYAAINSQAVIQNLDSGETLTDSLTVSSVDGTTHTVVMTINGVDEIATAPNPANSPAVISGTSSASVTEDVDPDGDNLLEVSGKLTVTDSDAGEAAFTAKTVNGSYGSLTINAAGSWNYAANNSQSAIQNLASGASIKDNLTVSSIDGTKKTVVITINGTDEATGPLADISLSWVAPVEREDNTPIALSEIASYTIYYGTKQGQYPNSVDVNDGSAEGYTLKALPAGIYFFVITTTDTAGLESQHSAEVKKVI